MVENNIKFQSDKYKKKVNFTEKFVEENFNKDTVDFIKDMDWEESPELCSNLLNNCLTIEQQNYLNDKLNLTHLKDRRKESEYALDLIVGWVLEDGILKILKEELGYEVNLSSADKNRKFLKSPEATPDMEIINERGTKIPLELAQDFTGYWQRKNKIDLRDNKYQNVKDENGVILGLDFKNEDFFITKVSETEGNYHRHFPYGGKMAYTFKFNDINFHDINEMCVILKEFFDSFG